MTCCIAIECKNGFVAAVDTGSVAGTKRFDSAPKISHSVTMEGAPCGPALLGAGALGSVQRVFSEWNRTPSQSEALAKLIREVCADEHGVDFILVDEHEGIVPIDRCGARAKPREWFYTTGSGGDLAFGFIFGSLAGKNQPLNRLPSREIGSALAEQALHFAAMYDTAVHAPFDIVWIPKGFSHGQEGQRQEG